MTRNIMINTNLEAAGCPVEIFEGAITARIITSTPAGVVRTIAISANDAKRSAVIKQLNGIVESQSTVVADLIAS